MGRKHFQQQHCADESMWMESQGQQQSYAFQEESWSSDNNYGHKQFPGMHMNMNNRLGAFAVDSDHSIQKQHGKLGGMHMNNRLGGFAMDSEHSMQKHHGKLGGSHGMFQEGMHSDHGYAHHGGGRKFPFGGHGNTNASHHFSNGGGHREYFSEESEYEEAYSEEHVGAVTANMNMNEMRYERHNWGGGDPYGRNTNHKPHKFRWTAKGV